MKTAYLKHNLNKIKVESADPEAKYDFVSEDGIPYKSSELLFLEVDKDLLKQSFCNHNGFYLCRTCNRIEPCRPLQNFLSDLNLEE